MAKDYEDVREYLSLHRHLVEATLHLEGNAKIEGDEGNRRSLWDVMSWLQVLYTKIDKKLRKLSNAPESQFKTSLLDGKEGGRWTSTGISSYIETPYYYTAIILQPRRQITWFEREWCGYST